MKYRQLGSTSLKVSQLCLGCMSFGAPDRGTHGWTLPEPDSRALIRQALDIGINFFDTADMYSDGTSEEYVGRALKDMVPRDEVVIATKIYFPMTTTPDDKGLSRERILRCVDASLQRLGTDYIDLYQIHRWDHATPIEETLEALHTVVRAGKARFIGASSTYAWEFSKALYLARQHGWTPFSTMQNHYNLLYREEEREMIPLCEDQRIGIVPWSPLARGRLTRPWEAMTERTRKDNYSGLLYDPTAAADRRVVEAVGEIAAARGVPMAQVALAWMLHKPFISAPIVGATQPQHLHDAAGALTLKLTAAEIGALESPYVPHPVAGIT